MAAGLIAGLRRLLPAVQAMAAKPLAGILVVAIEQAVAAPLCTLKLADAGARVIKIERAGGETARHYDSTFESTSAHFAWLNRGKQSAVLNLKTDADRAVLEQLLAQADVFVQNLVPGAMARMGLAPDVITARWPSLIHVAILGYGQDTRYADMRAYDLLVQAESGICAVTGTAQTAAKVGVSIADIATGMNAHAAILEAVIERGQSGRGQYLEIAMFDGMAEWMSVPLLHHEYADQPTPRNAMSHATIYPYRPFQCRDGALIVAVQTQREWHQLCCQVLDLPALAADKKYHSNVARSQHRDELDVQLEPAFARLTSDEAIERLSAAGVAWGRSSEVADLSAHPALRRTEVTLASGQRISLPRPAGRDAGFQSGSVPATGEHTETIRAEFSPA